MSDIGNSAGIVSDSAVLSAGQVMFGGACVAGDQSAVTVSVGGAAHPFTDTVLAGDTLFSVINRYIVAINAALGASGISAALSNPVVPMLAVIPLRNGNPLPSLSVTQGASLALSIVSQPVDILDANPVVYAGHVNPLAPPRAGDSVVLRQDIGPDYDHPTERTVAYAWEMTYVGDPRLASVAGYKDFGTAAARPAAGNVAACFRMQRGLQLFDNAGALPAGGDMGYGTINAKDLYIDGVSVRQKSAFVAALSAAQTVPAGAVTRLAFTALGANVGVPYDAQNARWQPPAGMVRLSVSLLALPPGSYIYIAKNGALLRGASACAISALDYANGADWYDVRVLLGAATTLDAQPLYTWFEGQQA